METTRNIINLDAIRIDKSMLDDNYKVVRTNDILDKAGFGSLANFYQKKDRDPNSLEKYKEMHLKLLLVKLAAEKYLNEIDSTISSIENKVHNEKIVDIIKKFFDSEIELSGNSAHKISLSEVYERIRSWHKNNYNDKPSFFNSHDKPPTSIEVRNYCKTNFSVYDNKTDKISGYKFINND